MKPEETDPLGQAIYDYHFHNQNKAAIQVLSSITFPDFMPVNYLFRKYKEMPELEKKALSLCNGAILDVGAAAGCHSMYLQDHNKDVHSLELSSLSCKVLHSRGLTNIINDDVYKLSEKSFDTVLMLMNGLGICGTLVGLNIFFTKLNEILKPGGKLIADSSDIRYMYEDDEGVMEFDLNDGYYGEIKYKMQYKQITGEEFDWLFIDFDTLKMYAEMNGFSCSKIMDGPHFDYLAEIEKF